MKKLYLVLCLVLFGSFAWATDYYVDVDASGANNGTSWTDAWESCGDMSSAAGAGDTVYFSDGNYGWCVIDIEGSVGNQLVFKTGSAHPTLSAGHTGQVVFQSIRLGTGGQVGYIWIDGEYNGSRNMRVTGSSHQGIRAEQTATNGITLSYIEIDNNGDGCGEGGIFMNQNSDQWIIEYCYIHDNSGDGINQNISPANSFTNTIVRHCKIEDNDDDGIQVGGGFTVHDTTIDTTNNKVYGACGYHPDGIQGNTRYWKVYNSVFINAPQGIYISNAWKDAIQHIHIYNNLFYNTIRVGSAKGVAFRYSRDCDKGTIISDDIVISNNLFRDLSYTGIRNQVDPGCTVDIGGKGNIQKNNIFLDCRNDITVEGTWTTAPSRSNNVGSSDTEPTFIDKVNHNYRLDSSDTVAKNQATSLATYFTTDADGIDRNQEGVWDIGPYEYH